MAFYRNHKRLQARATNGTFRRLTFDDVGIGVCPVCRTLTTQPPEPESFKAGFIDPVLFRAHRDARVCKCGWQNDAAKALIPPPASPA